jgi:hypothetical protein
MDSPGTNRPGGTEVRELLDEVQGALDVEDEIVP